MLLSLVLAMELSGAWGADAGWREQRLGAKLRPNQFEATQEGASPAQLRVRSQASMSLWARPLTVDLERTPTLCWRWRIEAPLKSADMALKRGDDYAARLYVAFALPPEAIGLGERLQLSLARRLFGDAVPDAALNFVWDNKHAVGHHAPNAYAAQTRMVVQRSGAALDGEWVQERRDLRADAARWLPAGARVTAIAVTADTDNTGESALAEFAELRLRGPGEPCS